MFGLVSAIQLPSPSVLSFRVVHWSADADFLAEPYLGSDAYVTDGRYMVSMVTTFAPDGLVFAD